MRCINNYAAIVEGVVLYMEFYFRTQVAVFFASSVISLPEILEVKTIYPNWKCLKRMHSF